MPALPYSDSFTNFYQLDFILQTMWKVGTPDPVSSDDGETSGVAAISAHPNEADHNNMSPLNDSLLDLERLFPWYTVPVPEHWMKIGLPENGTLIILILFSYGVNTLWFIIYRQ